MEKIFIFDVDGTLTPSRLPMTKEFQKFFSKWVLKNIFYLVTGSDLPKLQEQMNGMETHSNGIFTCCGNQFWQSDYVVHPKHADLIYDNKFELTSKLKNTLDVILMSSSYPHRYGNHIEDRGSMVNFSIVGRNCTQEQREHFFKWDNEKGERKKISTFLKHKFKDLDAVIGGQISIDIYPKGKDKSQILEHIDSDFSIPFGEQQQYIFIGDRTMKGGNDYPLAKLMEKTHDCSYHQTQGWEQTQKILEKLSD
jgi:phosphomannomutase